MNPASARRESGGDGSRRESRRLTLRPRVLDASSPSDSQAYAASAPPHQGPSVPGTPSRQQSFIRATPIRQQSFIRAIPSRQRPSVQAIPSSQRPLVHVIPSSQRPSVRATPSSQRPSVRATPSSQRPSVRAVPFSQRPTRSLQSVYRDRIADRLPKKYTQHEKVPPTRLVQGSKKIKIPEVVKAQAEGQDKRSKRFRDSFWHFCCSANGMLKVLRMVSRS
uniref:Chemokine-like factor superfamily 1 isoform 1 n=1 Tax=Mus musculus TaxID=10090 RepID=Q80VX8_MOUSE|nr:chemokine-like factor superfamily 1 isoform 1 [Mus musculus]